VKLSQKYTIALVPVLLLGIALLSGLSFFTSRGAIYESERETMDLILDQAIVEVLEERYRVLEQAGLTDVMSFFNTFQEESYVAFQDLAAITDRRFIIFDVSNGPLFDSHAAVGEEIDPIWQDIANDVSERTFDNIVDGDGVEQVFAAVFYDRPNWQWKILIVRPEMELSNRLSGTLFATLAGSILIIVTLAALLIVLSQRLLLAPITRLQHATRKIAAREEVVTIDIQSSDELGTLARDVEAMSHSIHDYVQQVDTANRAKSDFLASMSHEIRTPMMGVIGYSDMILEDDQLEPDIKDKVVKIKSSAGALVGIINDILDLSKLDAGKMALEPTLIELPSLIEDVFSVFESHTLSPDGPRITKSIDSDIPNWGRSDPIRLRQLLLNLVGNAVKFCPDGKIEVHVRLDGTTESGAPLIELAVVDSGIGIKADALSSIFDEFTQADASTARNYEGTGLGLAISRRLVRLAGGDIGVESTFGVGSRFWFTWPLETVTEEEIEAGRSTFLTRRFEAARTLHVLIAEDNPINQGVILATLESQGHDVTVANNGEEAVTAFEPGKYDLILMDVRMPKLNGLDATREIRRLEGNDGGVPIIALTADAMQEAKRACFEAGMTHFLAKPFERVDLLAALDDALGESVHLAAEGSSEAPEDVSDNTPTPGTSPDASPEGDQESSPPVQEETEEPPIGDGDRLRELVSLVGPAKAKSLLETTHRSMHADMVSLQEAIRIGNPGQISEAAHSIKGSSGSLCAVRLFQEAEQLQEISEDVEAVRTALPGFASTMTQTLAWWKQNLVQDSA